MELNQQDLPYYVAYVLLDEATRPPSGKRQTLPMQGFWMSRQGKTGMRESDGRFRRGSCMEALLTVGRMTVSKAAAYVAQILGRTTSADVNRIRVDHYEQRVGGNRNRGMFWGQFLSWREWVLESSEKRLQFFLGQYGEAFGPLRRCRLEKLMYDLRADAGQAARHREWLRFRQAAAQGRIDSNRWNPDTEWQPFATDLWSLGQLHVKLGEPDDGKPLLERSLAIWKSQGGLLPRVQVEAVRQLEELISQVTPS